MRHKYMTPEQKEAKKARCRKRYAEHHEERKASMRKRYAEHKEEIKSRMKKMRDEHREEYNAYMKKYHAEHKEEHNARMKKRHSENLNKNGVTKRRIRKLSGLILKKVHAKLDGYEIHHCFGYEDPDKFIYIPKKLHDEIHSFLKRLGIQAADNHWNAIRDMVNACEDYTYIRC